MGLKAPRTQLHKQIKNTQETNKNSFSISKSVAPTHRTQLTPGVIKKKKTTHFIQWCLREICWKVSHKASSFCFNNLAQSISENEIWATAPTTPFLYPIFLVFFCYYCFSSPPFLVEEISSNRRISNWRLTESKHWEIEDFWNRLAAAFLGWSDYEFLFLPVRIDLVFFLFFL